MAGLWERRTVSVSAVRPPLLARKRGRFRRSCHPGWPCPALTWVTGVVRLPEFLSPPLDNFLSLLSWLRNKVSNSQISLNVSKLYLDVYKSTTAYRLCYVG